MSRRSSRCSSAGTSRRRSSATPLEGDAQRRRDGRRLLVRVEDVDAERHALVGEADEGPALDVEAGLVGAGALDGETDLQPLPWRPAELGPRVEEVVLRARCVEDPLSLAVELERFPGESELVARRDARQVAEDTADHQRRVETKRVAETEVPADPGRPRIDVLVVVPRLQVQAAAVGRHGRLAIVLVLRDEVAVDAGFEFPAGVLGGVGCGGGLFLGPDRCGGQREGRRQREPPRDAHPPRAIVPATTTIPMAAMAMAVPTGLRPEYFPSLYPA